MTILEEFLKKYDAKVGDLVIVHDKEGAEAAVFRVDSFGNTVDLHVCKDSPCDAYAWALVHLWNADTTNIKIKKEIKPCPFCGSTNTKVITPPNDFNGCQVRCFECSANGPYEECIVGSVNQETKNKAIDAWNAAKR